MTPLPGYIPIPSWYLSTEVNGKKFYIPFIPIISKSMKTLKSMLFNYAILETVFWTVWQTEVQ